MTVNELAKKRPDILQSKNYPRELEMEMGEDFISLGFTIEINDFVAAYGNAPLNDSRELKKAINQITDIQLLGNAIFGKWRHITHWLEILLTRPSTLNGL